MKEVQGIYPDSVLMAAGWSLGGEVSTLQCTRACHFPRASAVWPALSWRSMHGRFGCLMLHTHPGLLLPAANILVRYLGEEGERTPIQAAISMCNPFNLVRHTAACFHPTI